MSRLGFNFYLGGVVCFIISAFTAPSGMSTWVTALIVAGFMVLAGIYCVLRAVENKIDRLKGQ